MRLLRLVITIGFLGGCAVHEDIGAPNCGSSEREIGVSETTEFGASSIELLEGVLREHEADATFYDSRQAAVRLSLVLQDGARATELRSKGTACPASVTVPVDVAVSDEQQQVQGAISGTLQVEREDDSRELVVELEATASRTVFSAFPTDPSGTLVWLWARFSKGMMTTGAVLVGGGQSPSASQGSPSVARSTVCEW